jgi:hypothetical protein
MAKLEQRPVDSGVNAAKGKDDAALVEWWKDRFAKIANIPTETARAGALLPQMRELSRTPEAERRRLVRARIQALTSLPSDQRERILSARQLTYGMDRALVQGDDAFAGQVAQELPGGGAQVGR